MHKYFIEKFIFVEVVIAFTIIGCIIALYSIHCGYDLEWFFNKLDKLLGRIK